MERRTWLAAVGAAAVGGAALEAAAAPSRPRERSLEVEAVQMPAWHTVAGAREPIAPGDTVTTAEEVETGEGAALVLEMPEGSMVRLGEKTRLLVQRFEVTPADGQVNVQSELKLFDGFFRFATAVASRAVGQRNITLGVRTATAGIRGTDFWAMTDAVHDAACLFEGRIDLDTRDQGALTLDKPTAFWARFFDQPVRPVGNATPDELQRFLGSTELRPGRGVAVAGGRWRVVAAAAPNAAAAQALAKRLRERGYPAVVKVAKKRHEVRINGFAGRADAQFVLERIATVDGVQDGRVALAA